MTAALTEASVSTASLPTAGSPPRRLAREQLLVAAGQLASGAGNLAFVLAVVHLLVPGGFADLATFLALYVLLHMPANSLAAGGALSPAAGSRARRRVLGAGVAVGGVLAAASVPLSHLLHLPLPLVLVLAAAAPGAGLVALARGQLFGLHLRGSAVTSLVVEPMVRLSVGVALTVVLGPVGGAMGVVAAGYAALAVAQHRARRALPPIARAPSESGSAAVIAAARPPVVTIVAFLLLAVLQNQDLVLANRLLPNGQAAVFAALSTLGGIAAFATSTVPLVLLPRAGARERAALRVALVVAAAAGLVAVLAALLVPPSVVSAVFGGAYADAARLAAPYLLAMALLGVARVLIASRCAQGREVGAVAAIVPAVVVQAVLILLTGTTAGRVAAATLAGTTVLAVTSAAPYALDRIRGGVTTTELLSRLRRPVPLILLGLMVAALAVRLVVTRDVWVDEATSVMQARMGYGRMLQNLRTTDVHPPLYFTLLWGWVHAFGDGELAIRLPSMLLGTALVPVLYGLGRDLWDRRAGLLAAAFAVIAPQAVWYSQEARMYALFMVLAALALWAQARALRGGGPFAWGGYALASAAMFWTQYFTVFQILAQQVVFAVVVWRRRHRAESRRLLAGWLVSALALAALMAPLLPFAHQQFAVNQAAGKGFGTQPSQAGASVTGEKGLSGYAVLANGLWAIWGYHSNPTMELLVATWPLLMLVALALLGRGRSIPGGLIAAVTVGPVACLFALGELKPFVFDLRYFIGIVPALLVAAARVITRWIPRRWLAVAAAIVAASSLGVGLVDQQYNQANPRRYAFHDALRSVSEHTRPGDRVVYSPQFIGGVVHYYAPSLPATALGGPLPTRGRVFLIGSFLDQPGIARSTGAALAQLRRDHRLARTFHYANVTVWEFS